MVVAVFKCFQTSPCAQISVAQCSKNFLVALQFDHDRLIHGYVQLESVNYDLRKGPELFWRNALN